MDSSHGEALTISRSRWIARGAIAVALLFAIGLAWRLLPVGDAIAWLVEWARSAGPGGALVYGAVYVAATVLFVPGLPLTLGAGFLYGPLWGTILISPASVVGATLSFLLGRTLLRERVAKRLEDNRRFRAIDRAIGEHGFKVVLLLRLSPVFPFSALNYALGVTKVRLRDYVLASFLGMMPATIVYTWLGSLVTSTARVAGGDAGGGGPARIALLVGGLVATIVAMVFIGRASRKVLERTLDEEDSESAS